MQKNISRKLIFILSILLIFIFIIIFVLGIYIGKYKKYPTPDLTYLTKSLLVYIDKYQNIKKRGEVDYISDELAKQYIAASSNSFSRQVDINNMRFELDFMKIFDPNASIAEGAGGIAIANNTLLIMDRLGNLFYFEKKNFKFNKIDTPKLNNGIEILIAKSLKNANSYRAHSVTFDVKDNCIYISYERQLSANKSQFIISKIKIDNKFNVNNNIWEDVFLSESMQVNVPAGAGKLLIDKDYLYFSVGVYPDTENIINDLISQNEMSSKGKIYKLDLKTNKSFLVSKGHRNPQGLAIFKDKLYSVEHGPQGGDELNLIFSGGNYGWPLVTFGVDYHKYDWPILPDSSLKSYTDPIFAWVPSIGVSSLIPFGNFNQKYRDNLLVGSLKAQSLFNLKIKDNKILFSEPIFIGKRIRDIVAIQDAVYLLTDDFYIVKISPVLNNNDKVSAGYPDNDSLKTCLSCHHFGPTSSTHMAPSLTNIFNRKVASDNFMSYSLALKSMSFNWTKDTLKQFLQNPQQLIPGTTMPNPRLDETQINTIIETLEKSGNI
jgi:cytochrome c2